MSGDFVYPNSNHVGQEPKREGSFERPRTADEVLAAAFYPAQAPKKTHLDTPASVAEFRKNDPERGFYDPQGMMRGGYLEKIEGLSEADRNEWREIGFDLGLGASELSQIVSLVTRTKAEPPSEETFKEWHEQSAKRLREVYGDGTARAMELAQKLTRRDPRLFRMLQETGLGSHPDVVFMFAEIARRQTLSGRL